MSHDTSADGKSKDGNLLLRFAKTISKLVNNEAKHTGVKDVSAKDTVVFQGWLRKRNTSLMSKARDSMKMKWAMFYVLVTDKSIYYFKNETSSSFAGKFSLYGYNSVRRVKVEEHSNWPEHSIMIKHASEDSQYKTYYFACAHYDEWKNWMRNIRRALIAANESLVAGVPRPRSDSNTPVDELETVIYPSQHFLSQNNHCAKEDSEIESDAEDYETIDDSGFELPPSRVRPKKGVMPSPATSYVEFDEEIQEAIGKSVKPLPRPPLPRIPNSADCSMDYQAQNFSPVKSLGREALPKFLNVSSSPATDVLKQLQEKQSNIQHRQQQEQEQNRGCNSKLHSVPSNHAPIRPFAYSHGFANPRMPMKAPLKPPTAEKPILPVKPRMMPQKLYWNGSKEEGSRLLRSSPPGVFIVRSSERAGTKATLVIAAMDGEPPHSVRIVIYADNTMGLKAESIATASEKFPSIQSLVKYYQQNCIHLRNGTVEITLTSAHPQCNPTLDEE